jgi:foldase protein PrsA
MKKAYIIFLSVFFIISFLSCSKPTSPTKPPEVKKESEIKVNGPLLARVNDWAMGLDDFKDYLAAFKTLTKAQYNIDLDITNAEIKREVFNNIVRDQILAQIGISRGLDNDDDIAKAVRDYKGGLVSKKMRDELEKKIEISYAETKSFYDQNKDRLITIRKPLEVKAREIMVESESMAKDIYAKILMGEDFATLARQYSKADTRSKGGDLDYLSYDPKTKFEKFWVVLSTLDKGEISNIFKDENGNCYIVKVEDVRGGEVKPFSEVESELKQALRARKLKEEEDKLIDDFKAKGNVVKIVEELLK